jgi:hypothetical protein
MDKTVNSRHISGVPLFVQRPTVTAITRLRMRASSARLRAWLVAALLGVLLAAETFAVLHPLDLAAHANGEACKICVGLASFAGANVADSPAGLAIDPALDPVVPIAALPLRSSQPIRQSARGPPHSS